MRRLLPILVLSLATLTAANAQTSAPIHISTLVPWYGIGGVPLPSDPEWEFQSLKVFDHAGRPVATYKNKALGVVASYIIFENLSGAPTPESCRQDIISAIQKNQPGLSNQTEGQTEDGHGGHFATASHWTPLPGTDKHNLDRFAFAGSAKTCAEIHVSAVSGTPGEDKLNEALATFHPDLSYHPAWRDYYEVALGIYETDPMQSAPFFDSALKSMPSDPAVKDSRRLATDVVTVTLERMGNLKVARKYAEKAIQSDPEYPASYYHLACIDASEGKAPEARTHLEQAFARKQNTIGTYTLPNPAADPSLLKLKNNKPFWDFVETLQ